MQTALSPKRFVLHLGRFFLIHGPVATDKSSLDSQAPAGFLLTPIHRVEEGMPLRLCVLIRRETEADSDPFVLLREVPGARVYLGALADVQGRIQEWLEIWVQTLELRDVRFSGYEERLSNHPFDERWAAECDRERQCLPEAVLVTGMELKNPAPILVKRTGGAADSPFAPVEAASWSLCRDDALLGSFGLPAYSTSPFRYLCAESAAGARTFLATSGDAPTNSHVQRIDRLWEAPDVRTVFNPHAGYVRVSRFSPLGLEDYLQVLEGCPWRGAEVGAARVLPAGIYTALQAWSANPKGPPFLLHGAAKPAERLNEVFFLKLSVLLGIFREVRASVKKHQLPLLNLTPASFRVALPDVGSHFPGLWAARVMLVRPSQAYPLRLGSTEQRYFIRLGSIEPSPFLPESVGAHSFGIGSLLLRNVAVEAGGAVLEGTLRADDYLGLHPRDLLWFRLPLAENQRVEFYAHVYASETVGPKEARFRTVPARLSESLMTELKRRVGTSLSRSPYEIWPLLSSPCDMFSLGVVAVRSLLANRSGNLPVILDDVLSLARYLGKEVKEGEALQPRLKKLLDQDPHLLDLVSPHALVEPARAPEQARSEIVLDLWLETIELVLRLFPGAGPHSYCRDDGDVSPLALEKVFDRPIQELETLVGRLRSVLVPSLSDNQEIAEVIGKELATLLGTPGQD